MKKELIPRRVFVNPIYKDKVTVLETRQQTAGAYSLGELVIYPGGGNFKHIHTAFEETFTAVKGVLGVMLRDTKHYLRPGESITVPLYTPHYFFNETDQPITCHVKFVPGHDDFIRGLSIGYGLAADGKTNSKGIPKSLTHLALLTVLTDTKPAGLLGKLFPVFKWLAKKARKSGEEMSLLKKYYYESEHASSRST